MAQIYAGASLLQFDNATLTFAGPNCVSEIHKNLLRLLKEKNFPNISRAVGFDVKGPDVSEGETQAPTAVSEPTQAETVSVPADTTVAEQAETVSVPPDTTVAEQANQSSDVSGGEGPEVVSQPQPSDPNPQPPTQQ